MRICSKDLFQTLQLEREKQVDQYYFKFSRKSSYGSSGQIWLGIDPKLIFPKNYPFDQICSYGSCGLNVAQLSHTSTQAFIWGFVLRIFVKFCSMVQHKKYKKITQKKFSKKSSSVKWVIWTWLWPRTIQAFISGPALRVSQKIRSRVKFAIFTWFWPKIIQGYISGFALTIFFKTLQHDKGQYVDKNRLSEISPKILSCQMDSFHAIFGQIMIPYILQSALKLFFQTLQFKFTGAKFSKNPLLG